MKSFYAFVACLAFAPAANAAITATFVQDEALFGVGWNTYALQVTTYTDWLSGDIDIHINSGNLINRSDGFPSSPKVTFVGIGDSGVFGSDLYPPDIAPGPVSTATQFTATWSTDDSDDVGTFYIGAFTFSPDADGTISGRVTALNPSDPLTPLAFDLESWSVVKGVVTHTPEIVPEPSASVLAGFAATMLVGMLQRRKA